MNNFKTLLFFTLFCLTISRSSAQPAVGEWTDYQSFASATNVVDTGEKIYCVTEGGLFSYNKADNSIQKMSGINGLSDDGIQRIAYSEENDLLMIAYENANIDFLIGNEIFNLSDIKRKQIAADKTINNVMFSGNLAFLSCGFGIVVINLEKKEIKDTYFIGNEGDYLNVQDLATDGDYLYAATVNGIYKADASEPNLQDYTKWIRQTSIPHADKKFSKIEYFKGKMIVNYTPDEWAQDELYALNGDVWSPFLTNINYVSDITTNGNYLVFSSREEVFVYDDKYEQVKYVPKYPFPGYEQVLVPASSAILDNQNILWVAYQGQGLVKIGTQAEKIVPQGPINNRVFSLSMNGEDLWITSGGRDRSWNNLFYEPEFQLYRDDSWVAFNSNVIPELNDFRDMVCVAVDPNNPDHVFAGSWGGGVLEFNSGTFVKQHNNYNSTLQTALPGSPDSPYVRIGGMAFDSEGNLWVTNSEVAKVISEYQPDGSWKAFELSGIANNYSIGKVVVTRNDDKWIVVPRVNGLYVLNSTNDQSKAQKVVARFVNSEGEFFTEMNDVYAMAEDLNGEIWVGTSGGVAVFSNPEEIWTESTTYATRPGLNLNDGLFHPLLETEIITAIAIDGANRKWFGTKTSGVFLISEDGETEIEHFNSENSPLPESEISDIAINQKTGEVFIGTASGLISYMGEATTGNAEFSDVYVYPNPVRETYEGPIVVTGLVEDTNVKITDISGNLVYKTISLGGQAIWDGKNLNGNRCKTGVYLVFMTDPTGEKTKITKLLFIH
ncbi:MAG TPA: T9SS type A sorting domain-containing protein [Prolixibacteraceae bacterium]|nr:T9SS type A sorting domain-containing protein [Prolixibacteraceae bacterium]